MIIIMYKEYNVIIICRVKTQLLPNKYICLKKNHLPQTRLNQESKKLGISPHEHKKSDVHEKHRWFSFILKTQLLPKEINLFQKTSF